ncbi:MAG: DUF4296 domain-containing protein [Flavitalea sp.]
MRLLLFVCAFAALVACTDHMKTPSGIIPRDKMELVLWDMIQADRYANNHLHKTEDSAALKKAGFELYNQVFQIHGITEKDFKKSYLFYMSHPDIAYRLFDSVVAHTDNRRKIINSAITKRDSLRNTNRHDSLKTKDLMNIKVNPGAFRNRKDSAIRAGLLNVRKDSASRAREISRRKDSANRSAMIIHKRDSLVRLKLLNKKKQILKKPATPALPVP